MAEFWRFFVRIETLNNGLYIVHTLVGPIICGQDQENSLRGIKPTQSTLSVSSNYELMPEPNQVQQFWDLESLGIRELPFEDDDKVAQDLFNRSIEYVDSRYRVIWP